MYKRIAAATAVILLASAIVVFSIRLRPELVTNDNNTETVIFQTNN